MSNTVVFNVSTNAQPTMTVHSMKYALYLQSDLSAIISSQTFAPPHAQRTVSFPGLLRKNYRFRLLEMNGAVIVKEMDYFDFVPDNDELKYKTPEEIQADVTPGIASATNTFTFDGSGGTQDWRGWNVFVERVGLGTMQRDIQYSWDIATGTFTLLTSGDEFQPNELLNFEFELVVQNASGVPVQGLFTGVMIVTGATTLTDADAGKMIIIKGASNFFEITLPDINTIQESVPFYFESGVGNHKCVRIKTTGGQTIDWMKGSRTDIKIRPCEFITLFKNIDTAVSSWRVFNPSGNFLKVGRIITTDAEISDEYNCAEMDGSSLSVDDDARLYEDFVQQLPPSQVCNFADWATGNNKYKFSYASGGLFKIPDRRNLYDRNSDGSILPGVYQDDMILTHEHETTSGLLPTALFGRGTTIRLHGTYNGLLSGLTDLTGPPVDNAGASLGGKVGSETRPKTYVTRKFILR